MCVGGAHMCRCPCMYVDVEVRLNKGFIMQSILSLPFVIAYKLE